MLARTVAIANAVWQWDDDVQEVETDYGPALNYVALTGWIIAGNQVLLNRTARVLGLGTGGYDFVMANLSAEDVGAPDPSSGRIMKQRYTPTQHAVRVLEEDPDLTAIWDNGLDGFPVVVGQLHSQIAPAAAALTQNGKRVAYVMTDGAALPIGFSKLVRELKEARYLQTTITVGQASGGDNEAVTVHSALLAAHHALGCDAAIVCQGPGNTGTATRYGFSGIEQAGVLDTVATLGGTPIAIARLSQADARGRHQGISHHTTTSLALAHSSVNVPLPVEAEGIELPERHILHQVMGTRSVIDAMIARGIEVTSMGRMVNDDPLFFMAAAAAGLYAAEVANGLTPYMGEIATDPVSDDNGIPAFEL